MILVLNNSEIQGFLKSLGISSQHYNGFRALKNEELCHYDWEGITVIKSVTKFTDCFDCPVCKKTLHKWADK